MKLPRFISSALSTISFIALLSQAQAGNLLLNPSFELPPQTQTVPTDWTFFLPPTTPNPKDYWIINPSVDRIPYFPAEDGAYVWKEWFIHNGTNNVAGLYQTFSASAGAVYQASGWFATPSSDTFGPDCAEWIQVEFLDAHTNLVALYKSDNFNSSVGTDTFFYQPITNVCDLSQPVSVGDPYFTTYAVTGSVSQLVAPPGTASVRYRFCYLTYGGEGGSAYFDDAVLNQISGPVAPVISALFPQDTMIFVNPSNGLSFTASSPSGVPVNNSGIQVTINGSNVSSGLSISGTASSKNVAYSGLQSNTAYTVSINVSDAANLTVNASLQFQTMWFGLQAPTYLWEAEDWDFTNGMYIDFPDLCNAPGDPNCYFGKVGVLGTDENSISGASGPYRPGDFMGQRAAGDALRPNLYNANRTDYRIDPFIGNPSGGGEWVNYTRDWPNSTNWVIGRLSANIGDKGSLALSVVNVDSTTTQLGTFSMTGQGYGAFQNVYLKDTNGVNAVVVLNGKQTLRVTTLGNLLPNFFMLVQAQPDLPQISNMYPTGTQPFEPTNTFSFTVTTLNSSFPTNGIQLILDGINVSSNLVITGPTSTKSVVYPNLLSNAVHFAVVTITNVLGHGIALTNDFDTFSQLNYMYECEDFDYGGGQFITPWFPDAYSDANGPWPAETNIDFAHTIQSQSEVFNYRAAGVPQDRLTAGPSEVRTEFIGNQDYVLVFFYPGDWANYTRDYPPGNYYAYIRTSGDPFQPFTMYLDQVVRGIGTSNQTTMRIGQFSGQGMGYTTWQWAPLTDAGLVAPAVLKLNGTNTLRLTTAGNANPNFIMLVPASGIRLTVGRSGGNSVISFNTQPDVIYRVFYRTNLTTGSWTLLTSVVGNGSTKSVTDPATGAGRFYKVQAP